jgi:HK97 family phage portal protein
MLGRIKAAWSALTKSDKPAVTTGTKVLSLETIFGGMLNGVPLTQLRNYQSYLQAGANKVWALWKACNVVATVALDTPYQLQRIGGDGTAVQHKDIQLLFTKPNQWESLNDMLYKWIFHMKMTGNAFWFKDSTNALFQRPQAIYTLNPKRMQVVINKNFGPAGYIYRPQSGLQIPMELDEVIHFRLPHPDNDYWGLGEVESAEPLFNEHINRDTWAEQFWKNGAAPSGILITEDQITDQNEFDKAKEKWQKEYGGTKNSGKTAWLTGKWKYEQLGLTAQEMQNIEQQRWSVEQIFMQTGVPLSVAGVKEAANYATAAVDDLRFRRFTVKPLLKVLADQVTTGLVAGWDPRLQMAFQISGLTDLGNISQNFVPLFDRGVISINELRVLAGLPAIKGDPLFDQHFITAGLTPLELAGVVDQGQTQQAAQQTAQRFIQSVIERKRLQNAN